MAWHWYSKGDVFTPPITPTDELLIRSFELFQGTAKVHKDHNFKKADLKDYLKSIRDKVDDEFLVMVFDADNTADLQKVICFQKSKSKFGDTTGFVPANEDAWAVSYGFDQAKALPDKATPSECIKHVHDYLTPNFDAFIKKVGVNFLYTVELSDPTKETFNKAIATKIGRLQTFAYDEDWTTDPTDPLKVEGSGKQHILWGKDVFLGVYFRYFVSRIKRK